MSRVQAALDAMPSNSEYRRRYQPNESWHEARTRARKSVLRAAISEVQSVEDVKIVLARMVEWM